jgi:hypothetical protein
MNPFAAARVECAGGQFMTQVARQTRPFSVHARHLDRHHARVVEEASFEAAAVAYVEDLHPPIGDGDEISVIVREVGTGHEHCFRIDLESGQTAPCG